MKSAADGNPAPGHDVPPSSTQIAPGDSKSVLVSPSALTEKVSAGKLDRELGTGQAAGPMPQNATADGLAGKD